MPAKIRSAADECARAIYETGTAGRRPDGAWAPPGGHPQTRRAVSVRPRLLPRSW